ncbi:PQQ-dependent sugar dehydrogenase [uncultured Maribacter sp.]|uniref:PQQ-dependent sugar dehydrogenase n=2 Tax=uncultured Maribacter sp. TaxID=431308 RepID=UPI00261F5E49|nr:PQQ-dependent sugar dehydrogenase [uncultured Maribacter sp.]
MIKMKTTCFFKIIVLTSLLVGISCKDQKIEKTTDVVSVLPSPDSNNGDIIFPNNFGAIVVHEGIGKAARHMVVRNNGDIYVNMHKPVNGIGLFALRDTTGNGKADIKEGFTDYIGTGIDINDGYLYASSPMEVFRYPLVDEQLLPDSKEELVVSGFLKQNDHISKPFTFDNEGNIYVTVGSPTNACQEETRSPGSKGMNPCLQLELQAGIWSYKKDQLNQVHGKDGFRYATGIRNAMGIDWNFETNSLYAMQHGRDQLNQLWPDLYTEEQNAELPAEEFLQVDKGDDFGWPYCYYDQIQNKKILGPEYGGDSKKQGLCANIKEPIIAFPGHLAPNDLLFYTGDQFPSRYKNGAFVAFHGSWNRAPLPQQGFFVAFVPFKNGKPTGDWEIFANGFAGMEEVKNPADAVNRPMGLAQGPDGSLYIVSSSNGKIWRVMYYGENANIKKTVIVNNTNKEDKVVESENIKGKKVYETYCLACHQSNGKGVQGLNPPLTQTDWVSGDKEKLIGVILNGMEGEKVDGESYRNIMASHRFLSDEDIADVLTYVRSSFGNDYEKITSKEVGVVRSKIGAE